MGVPGVEAGDVRAVSQPCWPWGWRKAGVEDKAALRASSSEHGIALGGPGRLGMEEKADQARHLPFPGTLTLPHRCVSSTFVSRSLFSHFPPISGNEKGQNAVF